MNSHETKCAGTGLLLGLCAAAVLTLPAASQRGSATTGYYPLNYGGSTFTGVIVQVNAANDEITLSFRKKDKDEVFVGRLEAPCGVPPRNKNEKGRVLRAVDMPLGTRLVAYYNVVSKKDEKRKWKENVIIAIRALEVNGQQIPEDKQVMSFCTKEGAFAFRAY